MFLCLAQVGHLWVRLNHCQGMIVAAYGKGKAVHVNCRTALIGNDIKIFIPNVLSISCFNGSVGKYTL